MCILTFYIAVKFLCIRILVFLKQFNKHVWIEIVEKLNGNDISVYRLSFEIKKKGDSFVQVYTIFVGSFLSVAKATAHNFT